MNSISKQGGDEVRRLVAKHRLPQSYLGDVSDYFLPIAQDLSNKGVGQIQTILGVQGCQGSGKSTFSEFLASLLKTEFEIQACIVSLDDFYFSRAHRTLLANQVHPLLTTRGVPGTHDVDSMQIVFDRFKRGAPITLPRFDKATDNPLPKDQWLYLESPPPLLIFEGWCVGVGAQSEQELLTPINPLEREEDPSGRWRRFVNQQIEQRYQAVYQQLDALTVLQAPSFESVYEWRSMQEQKLRERLHNDGLSLQASMSPRDLARFIQFYQRLTEHALSKLGGQADYLLQLDFDHSIADLHIKSRPSLGE